MHTQPLRIRWMRSYSRMIYIKPNWALQSIPLDWLKVISFLNLCMKCHFGYDGFFLNHNLTILMLLSLLMAFVGWKSLNHLSILLHKMEYKSLPTFHTNESDGRQKKATTSAHRDRYVLSSSNRIIATIFDGCLVSSFVLFFCVDLVSVWRRLCT